MASCPALVDAVPQLNATLAIACQITSSDPLFAGCPKCQGAVGAISACSAIHSINQTEPSDALTEKEKLIYEKEKLRTLASLCSTNGIAGALLTDCDVCVQDWKVCVDPATARAIEAAATPNQDPLAMHCYLLSISALRHMKINNSLFEGYGHSDGNCDVCKGFPMNCNALTDKKESDDALAQRLCGQNPYGLFGHCQMCAPTVTSSVPSSPDATGPTGTAGSLSLRAVAAAVAAGIVTLSLP